MSGLGGGGPVLHNNDADMTPRGYPDFVTLSRKKQVCLVSAKVVRHVISSC